jgi:hypothetical protein
MTDCWIWGGATSANGYGTIWDKQLKTRRGVHRYFYEKLVGPIPRGLLVCHECDNPLCYNPDHLFLGTQHDNMLDSVNKGRSSVGDLNGRAKLSSDDVDIIISRELLGDDMKFMAIEYGVSHSQICRIVNGKRWNKTSWR